ncbi:7-cyano-7-deazaguanine synthase QueC [Pseudomonadales bacterium]|nr:7-cyano-7-deazaguanine synthase QueC [Pseudomonadales bacterium]
MSRGKAIVLLSGGLDSATVLAMATDQGYECHCLSFDYGQRHRTEIEFAAGLAAQFSATEHRTIKIDLRAFGGSALTDDGLEVPVDGIEAGVPITYVPARNTIFLSYALGYAEVLPAHHIFIGVNAVDYSGYPDCRPEFVSAFEALANTATRIGTEGERICIETPLIDLKKEEIILTGAALGVDYSKTVSCYQLTEAGTSCGECDSCRIRIAGFAQAGIEDPTCY